MARAHNTRLDALERTAPSLPWLTLAEDMDDPSRLRVHMFRPPSGMKDGDEFSRDDIPRLERDYTVMIMSWAKDRPVEPDPDTIVLRWEDGDDDD